tara:strand:+ start:4577 stop:4804 length:228 start_codon:yes stop_codon:yes gene_type:complete
MKKEIKNKFEVYCGNIGTVYSGNSAKKARESFKEYTEQSEDKCRHASGEDVELYEDGELIDEFIGKDNREDAQSP